MDDVTIDTYVIDGYKYFIFIFIYVTTGMLLTLFLVMLTNMEIIIFIGVFISIILPGIFGSFFRKRFTKEAKLLFTGSFLTISVQGKNDINIPYAEISSFKVIDSAKDDSLFVRINMKNKKYVKYTFINQGQKYLKTPVIDILFNFINIYNINQKEKSKKITLSPSLFASKAGKLYIYVIYALLILCIIIQVFLKPKTIPFSILGALTFSLVIFAQRKRDIEVSKKLTID